MSGVFHPKLFLTIRTYITKLNMNSNQEESIVSTRIQASIFAHNMCLEITPLVIFCFRYIVSEVKLNLPNMMKAKERAVTGLTRGIEGLFKKYGVDYVKGFGRFTGSHEVEVDGLDGKNILVRAKNIIIATGSEPTPFKGLEVGE